MEVAEVVRMLEELIKAKIVEFDSAERKAAQQKAAFFSELRLIEQIIGQYSKQMDEALDTKPK